MSSPLPLFFIIISIYFVSFIFSHTFIAIFLFIIDNPVKTILYFELFVIYSSPQNLLNGPYKLYLLLKPSLIILFKRSDNNSLLGYKSSSKNKIKSFLAIFDNSNLVALKYLFLKVVSFVIIGSSNNTSVSFFPLLIIISSITFNFFNCGINFLILCGLL